MPDNIPDKPPKGEQIADGLISDVYYGIDEIDEVAAGFPFEREKLEAIAKGTKPEQKPA